MRQKMFPITWANGATQSSAADVRSNSVVGIDLPAAFTGATLSFEAAVDVFGAPGSWKPMVDRTGLALQVTVTQGARIAIAPQAMTGQGWVRLVSNVAQAAARSATLLGVGE